MGASSLGTAPVVPIIAEQSKHINARQSLPSAQLE
jgi:hypothetical protein